MHQGCELLPLPPSTSSFYADFNQATEQFCPMILKKELNTRTLKSCRCASTTQKWSACSSRAFDHKGQPILQKGDDFFITKCKVDVHFEVVRQEHLLKRSLNSKGSRTLPSILIIE